MKSVSSLAVLLFVAVLGFPQDVQYFPKLTFDNDQQQNDFIVQWYTKHLKALQEPSLLQQASNPKRDLQVSLASYISQPNIRPPDRKRRWHVAAYSKDHKRQGRL